MRTRMTLDQYQKLAMRTSPKDGHDKLDNAVLGLIGETGELVDVYKKWQYQSGLDAPLPAERFADELGDVLWYLAELADGMDKPMSEIAKCTMRELAAFAEKNGRKRTMRTVITGLAARANRTRRAVDQKRQMEVCAEFNWMLKDCAYLAWQIGYSMEEIACRNIEKLKKRYPEGFDAAISMGRYKQ